MAITYTRYILLCGVRTPSANLSFRGCVRYNTHIPGITLYFSWASPLHRTTSAWSVHSQHVTRSFCWDALGHLTLSVRLPLIRSLHLYVFSFLSLTLVSQIPLIGPFIYLSSLSLFHLFLYVARLTAVLAFNTIVETYCSSTFTARSKTIMLIQRRSTVESRASDVACVITLSQLPLGWDQTLHFMAFVQSLHLRIIVDIRRSVLRSYISIGLIYDRSMLSLSRAS